jgi:hypothetical protein
VHSFIALKVVLRDNQNIGLVCLFVTMRPAGTRCIFELYWHNITSFNNNSFHMIHAPVRFEPASTRDPAATHHLSLPGLRYKTLLTTCQTSSPVEVWHVINLGLQYDVSSQAWQQYHHIWQTPEGYISKDIYILSYIRNLQKGYYLSFFGAGYFEDIISYF